MKKVLLYALLCIEAGICIAAAFIFPTAGEGGFMAAQQIPFAQIGLLLRALSLSSGEGNAFAFVMYILVCCIPAAFLLIKLIRKRAKAEDAMLAVMSGYLFYLIYMMINPGAMGNISIGSESFGKAVLGGVFWSMLIGWLILKLLRFVKSKDTASILRMLGMLFTLTVVIIVFYAAYVAVYAGMIDLKAGIKELEAYNYIKPIIPDLIKGDIGTHTDTLLSTKVFFVFRYVAGLIPAVLDILIFLMAKTLTERLRKERYSIDVVNTSGRLASLCKYSVVIIIISSIAVNVIQLLFSESLRSMNFDSTIPLGSVILALVMLLLSRYLADSRSIKHENEMFV